MYRLVIVHDSQDAWADLLEDRVRTACERVLRNDAALIRNSTVADALAGSNAVVVVCLCTTAAVRSADVAAELESARENALPVLPIVMPGESIQEVVPPAIARLNAQRWGSDPDPAMTVLRLLGIAESDRRLFLSYRRVETSSIAIQLRRALSERSYDVFLDRFSVPPGADFQQRINVELSDKAFLLVLESASAVGSDWVQHEVVYALSHHIGVLALAMPGTRIDQQFEVIDESFRLRLAGSDLDTTIGSESRLTANALDVVPRDVVDSVEG